MHTGDRPYRGVWVRQRAWPRGWPTSA